MQLGPFMITAMLGSVLALSGMQGNAPRLAAVQVPEPPVQPQDPEETEEEKAKKKKQKELEVKKRQQQEQEKKQQQQQQPRQQQPPPPPPQQQQQQRQQEQQQDKQQQEQQRQKQQQENQRQEQLQEQQERELQQKRQQEQRQLQQKRVSKQEQQERIRKQEAELAQYRKNLALKREIAERDARILQQQKRIAQLRAQREYLERLRLQEATVVRVRYDFYNDPFYYTAPNYRYHRAGRYYQTNQYGIRMLEHALQAGYNEGYRAGRADREDRWRYDYRSTIAYQDANFGYDGRYIRQDEYNYYFREGFERGYEDGYYGRQKYGRRNDSGGINDEWLIAGAVVAAIIGYEILTD